VRLILWDIDGTLVHTAGHGRHAFFEAFESVFGHALADHGPVPMAGRTDRAIALDVMERGGVEEPERHLPDMFDALHQALGARAAAISADGRPQPGVPEALRAVGERPGVVQSLLTGNIEANAQVKLGAFGLDSLVEMDVGGYGRDHITRSELVRVARRKAHRKHGEEVAPADVTLVGDTPLDVEAAHTAGARAVAVATGPYRRDELDECGPEAALEDLSDLDALLSALSLPLSPPRRP
jgi:phosphoglycolate phosphatase-like HAD superfamily hydrolase